MQVLHVLDTIIRNIIRGDVFVKSLSLDINECTADTDNCQQMCSNTQGSFSCSCRSGYTLDSNGRTCSGESSTIAR